MNRIRMLLATLAVAAVVPGGAAAADEYVPFVTDFPKASERYVPFVSDFPSPVTPAPEPEPARSWIDWGNVPVEGVGAVFAAVLAGSALALARRRQSEPRLGNC